MKVFFIELQKKENKFCGSDFIIAQLKLVKKKSNNSRDKDKAMVVQKA